MLITQARSHKDISGPWPAPAKLNLMLRVLGRRTDGYHELQTVFQFINVYDWLCFRKLNDRRILRISGPVAVPESQDLAVRAASALQQATGCDLGVEIFLDKRLPIGGGLGGGSSDAATTLVALNKLWRLGLPQSELLQLGLTLGADVPVFIAGHAAWGEGVGERLTSVNLPEYWYLVLVPPCQVATGTIFSATELTRDSLPVTMSDYIAGNQSNDCMPVVRLRYPQVDAALKWLESSALSGVVRDARLTGTGACVFSSFATKAAACAALSKFENAGALVDLAGVKGFIARGLNESPLIWC